MPRPASPAAQDYLKALYMLENEALEARPGAAEHADEPAVVATAAIAGRLGVSAASATNMLKKLDSMGLVNHAHYRGALLSDAGRKVALEVVRHHRLLETYLAEALGVPWDRVHAEAEVLEHVLSEDLEDRIAALLGDPTSDPHGHPIPTKDGAIPDRLGRRLWDAHDGELVAVELVPDQEAEALRYLAELGIKPSARLEIISRGPGAGPLFVRVEAGGEDRVCALSRELAETVWVV